MADIEHRGVNGGLLRVGVRTINGARRYKFSVTHDDTGPLAEIIGFYHKGITRTERDNVIREINTFSGKLVFYERTGPPQAWFVQVDPAITGGRIVMRRSKQPPGGKDDA